MKRLYVLARGLADEPVAELADRTPLEMAKTPNLDRLAQKGRQGLVEFAPHGVAAGGDVSVLAMLGYDPAEYYTGLAPLEAAAAGVQLVEGDVAFRMDLVTVLDDALVDPTAGNISAQESKLLLGELSKRLGEGPLHIHAVGGHKNIAVLRDPAAADALDELECTPPRRALGQLVSRHLPKGKAEKSLTGLMEQSRKILEDQEINRVRIDLGENPANMAWFWGQGKRPVLPPFAERFGVKAALVSAEDYARGAARLAGLDVEADVARALEKHDAVFVFWSRDLKADDLKSRVLRIEEFDSKVLGPALKALEKYPDSLAAAGTDGPDREIGARGSAKGPVVAAGTGVTHDGSAAFGEKAAAKQASSAADAHRFTAFFMGQEKKGK